MAELTTEERLAKYRAESAARIASEETPKPDPAPATKPVPVAPLVQDESVKGKLRQGFSNVTPARKKMMDEAMKD